MQIQQVFPTRADPVDLFVDDMNLVEKNWTPLRYDLKTSEMIFTRFIEPHDVLACHLTTGHCRHVARYDSSQHLAVIKDKLGIKTFHLAANTIQLSARQSLGVLHGRVIEDNSYLPLAYVVESVPPYRVLGMGQQQLCLPIPDRPSGVDRTRYVYVHSLRSVNSTHILVGYNVRDHSVTLAVLPLTALLNTIQWFTS
ncbi:uncharacterized protein MONBRDRAFT_13092 [Monosiga brevicollis MX1]|uniref:Uncharacterized protein n=1 Tax=Monosiga brevicollis TaxID=81824 RepID=A9VE98_MONBE|nr:uncharacterized protein MONBRDRAFT_13092 [Monosiga brevicollis MX1]EDQ84143.1 predicted protein [Monosiga brevicollis MX1]|eukprot:XP_001751046.1 hypothetical protein [Monosiga brevicollis MX1]